MTMTQYIFQENELRDRLATLPCWKIVAFALCCAERLMPAYTRYSEKAGLNTEDSELYANALELIWNQLLGQENPRQDIENIEQKCLGAIPTEDSAWEHGEPYAEDAAAAVTYAIRSWLLCSAQEAVYAARRIYEAVEHYIANTIGTFPQSDADKQQIYLNPLIQQELSRQKYDLEQLETSLVQETLIIRLHSKAHEDAITVFSGIPSDIHSILNNQPQGS